MRKSDSTRCCQCELLVQMVEYHFTSAQMDSIGSLDFITEDMIRYRANVAVTSKLLASLARIPVIVQAKKNQVHFF